ncbi:DUF4920 domain-containing protein [Sphingobacteriales bacterium CHB3]|nr:DUF4920 domain-containing protein [Sphingobacteriales bacterium CHB3]
MTHRHVLSIAAILVLIGSIAIAGPKNYGKKLTLKEKTKVSDILANPEQYDGKKVLVEGAVVDVCANRGCWIKVASDKEFESIRFKVDDGVIVFPMDAKGKTALAEGVISVKKYTVEELIEQGKHHAEEQGEEFDPSTVKGPKTVVQIKGEGAVIK